MNILTIEDNPNIRKNIVKFLKMSNFIPFEANNGIEGLKVLDNNNIDLVLLDINMPEMNGKDFIKNIRSNNNNIPVIMLTSNETMDEKIEGFNIGADDYITKPFHFEELIVRINALLKRKGKEIENIKKIDISGNEVIVDFNKKKILYNNKEIELAYKEYLLVELLAKKQGYPINKYDLYNQVWGESSENLEINTTSLEVHISNIRKKINKKLIRTIKGIGYIID